MTDYTFSSVLVWDSTGGAVKLARRQNVDVLDPNTGLTAAGLTQDGQPVSRVTTDDTGHVTFTATIPVVTLETARGFTQDIPSNDLWSEYVGGSVTFAASGEVSTTKAVRADDSRLSDTRNPKAHTHAQADVTGLTTALADLNEPRRSVKLTKAGTSTDTRTAVGVRIPFRAPFSSSKFRVHVRNRNPQTGVTYAGALSGTAIGIGTAQTSGDTVFPGIVEATSPVVQGSFTTPADGSEYQTGWKTDFPLVGGTWYHLSYGYNGPAQTNYAGDGVAWTNTSPTSVLNKSAFSSKVSTAPLDVWLEIVPTGGTTPEIIYAGQVPTAAAVYPVTTSSRTKISAFGDSLTDGGANGVIWPEADSWPSKLALELPGTTVTNLGFSSATVDEMLIRVGARHPRFTVTGGSIPSSGTVDLTTTEDLGIPTSRVAGIDGTLGGFTGRLLVDYSGTGLTFTTYGAAPTTAVSGPLEFVPLLDGHYGDTAIVWIGRNDVTYDETGPDASVAAHVVGGVQRLVEWLTPQVKQIMIVGTTTQTNETTGQTRWNTITEINDRLAELYPGKFKSIQTYLMTQALTDMGITPTAQDTTNIANGTLPESVLEPGDIGHISKATAQAVATYFFAPYLRAKGWVS